MEPQLVGAWDAAAAPVELEAPGESAWLLWRMSMAYHAARFALVQQTRRGSVDLWLRERPVDDAGMRRWTGRWDSFLDVQERQMQRIAGAYARASMRAGGYPEPQPQPVSLPSQQEQRVRDWLASPPQGLDPDVGRQVEDALARLKRLEGDIADLARLDRAPWLHSPVVEVRTSLSQGAPLQRAVQDAAASVAGKAESGVRQVERDTVGGLDWPRFKNGQAMLYKRVPQSGACGWCRVVATRLYSLASFKQGAQWHTSCHCTWSPVPASEAAKYAEVFKGSGGNYYKAAAAVGLWSGSTEAGAYSAVVGERAAKRSP